MENLKGKKNFRDQTEHELKAPFDFLMLQWVTINTWITFKSIQLALHRQYKKALGISLP